MALIKCSECSAEISDKASCCPKCGAPVVVHKWRCSKCGNMISEEPCPYCSNAQTTVNTNAVSYESNVGTTPAFVAKKKRNLGMLVTCLAIVAIAIIVIAIISQNGSSSNKSPDPNRTHENCSFLGTANVYPALHCQGNCYPDGDGYYWPVFGHHHHK